MKASEVHALSDEEIAVEQERIRRQLYDLRAQAVTEKLENPRQIGELRKDIARMLTELRRRQLETS